MATKIILYHVKWCGHCVRFQPVWEDLKQKVKEHNITLETYEADANPEEIKKANIKGFPTIKITKNGKEYDYSGDRTANAIMKELTSSLSPSPNPQTGGFSSSSTTDYKKEYLNMKTRYIRLMKTFYSGKY